MKLNVPCFEICDVPLTVVDNIANNISEEEWGEGDYRSSFKNLDETESILIMHSPQCSVHGDDRSIESIEEQAGYNKFYPLVRPVLEILSNFYQYNKFACFLARLKSGKSIGVHTDGGNFLTKCHRIHLPIVTHEKVEYCIKDRSYFWKKGTLYEFDNTLPHAVFNNSPIDRVHLVINLYNV
jgi:hypothetical protein